MRRRIGIIKRAVSVLLIVAVFVTALPWTGMEVHAAGQEAWAKTSLQAERDLAEEGWSQAKTGSSKEEPLQVDTDSDKEEFSQPGADSDKEESSQPGADSDKEDSSQIGTGSNEEGASQEETSPEEEDPSQTEESPEEEDHSQTEAGPEEDSSQTEAGSEEEPSQAEEESDTADPSQETGEDSEEPDSDQDTEMRTNAEETVLGAEEDYPVYDNSLRNLTVTPGSYHASILAEMRVNTNLKFCILYTTKDASENDFFPGQASITDSAIVSKSTLNSQGYGVEEFDYIPHLSSDGQYYDSWTADFSDKNVFEGYYAANRLMPSTTYRYRIACRMVNSDGMSYTYNFLSRPQEFTTREAVETSAVSLKDVSVDENGYSRAKISWTVENPDNEYIVDTYITGSAYGETRLTEGVEPCLDEDGYVIPNRYCTRLATDGKEQDFQLKTKVYIGTEEEQVITAQEFHIVPAVISEDDITVDFQSLTTSVKVTVDIAPWYDADGAADQYSTGYMSLAVYYRAKGTAGAWKEEVINLREQSGDVLIQNLSENAEYEYYVNLRTGRYNILWSRGSEEEPFVFTTSERMVYQDSDFPDPVLRDYIKERLGLSSGASITSDRLDTLTSLTYSNNYPEANYKDQYSGTGIIRSLEGIQYMKNLTTISLYNHGITDASLLSGLKNLKFINLQLNDLTQLPDLSGLSLLQSAKFEANKITADSITSGKLPDSFCQANPEWIQAAIASQLYAVRTPTQEEIIQRYAELPWSDKITNIYAETPSVTEPYALGKLSDVTLNNALNMLNFARCVAGVRDDVTLDDYQLLTVQAGALLTAVNQKMSHMPSCPSGYPEDLYGLGCTGCFSSNLVAGFSSLPYSIYVWLCDNDSTNVSQVGHRRGALDPTMRTTGFGAADNKGTTYSAMQVYGLQAPDRKRGTVSDFVAWPARNTPTQFMTGKSYPWSISLGSDYYLTDTSAVTVTLKNAGTGRTWTFNSSNTNINGNYLNIDEMGGFGLFHCIVFRPKPGDEVTYVAGTRYEVSVSGLKDREGKTKPLSYTVEFFDLPGSSSVDAASISLDKTTLNMQPGQTEILTATVKPDNATDKTVIWSSSNEAVASVDQNGTVTAAAPGDAVITAVTYSGKKASCKITVREYSLDKAGLYFDLAEGIRTETLTVSDGVSPVKDAAWSSSDESVATVTGNGSGSGVVTPAGSGEAVIWCKIKNGPALSCTVTVKNDQLTAISLNVEECVMETGTTRKLRVYLIPKDTTLSADILWSSDNPAAASVEDGVIHAVSQGRATITATAGDCTASCTVTVCEPARAPAEESVPVDLMALSNVQKKLSDVSLQEYEGWKWVYGEAPLTRFAGEHRKSFAAVYSRDGYADWQDSLAVSVFTLTGMKITADSSTLGRGMEAAARIQWNLTGQENPASEKVMSAYEGQINWSSSKPSVVKVTGQGVSARLEAVGTGKASVKAQITLGGKNFKAQYAVTVVEGEAAGLVIDSVDGLEAVSSDAEEMQVYNGNVAHADAVLCVTVTNATRVTAKSSNSGVVKVGKVSSVSEGKYRIPLTVQAAGMARIIFTLNDAAKTRKEIALYISDPKPNISEDAITVNRLKSEGTLLRIYANEGYSVAAVTLAGTDAAGFTLTQEDSIDGCSYRIKANSGSAKGRYKLEVKVSVAGTDYALPLTVNVTEQTVKYTVKQSTKANLFYTDLGAPQITVTSDERVTDIALENCDFKVESTGDSYLIIPKSESGLTTSCNRQGTLKITFDGYEPVYARFTVGVVKSAPKLSLDNKTVTLYPKAGITTATLRVLSGKQPLELGAVNCSSRFKIAGNELVLDGSDMDLSGASSSKEEIRLTSDQWTEGIILPCTVKVDMGVPSLKLQSSSLQLNANTSAWAYDTASTVVMWKNGAEFDEAKTPVSVSAADRRSREVINTGIIFETAAGKITARLNRKEVAAGSYKFKVNVRINSTDTVSVPLTVKIVNTDIGKVVKLSAKGTIDVLNREGSFVTVTPSLKALNGSIVDDRISLSGRSAHLFRVSQENDKFIIRAREDVSLITKYNYGVCLNFSVENADGETMRITTPEIRLKLKQGKARVVLAPKGAAFFGGAYNSVPVQVRATLKGAADPAVEAAELTNNTDIFMYESDSVSLLKSGAPRKGKIYSLKFRVILKGHADNEKPLMVKYSAKVR